jgi:hypothetical protein
MTAIGKIEEGYGTIGFEVVEDSGIALDLLEVHVSRSVLMVVLQPFIGYQQSATWYGPDAVALGVAVCLGQMPPAILADYCDETAPNTCDPYFRPGERLRRAR